MTTVFARSEEVKRLFNVGAGLARSAEASRAVAAATALARSEEVKRLSSIGAAIARSTEASGAVAAATALARSEEVKRLSSIGAAIARSTEASGAVAAATALARSEEVKRLSSIGAAIARSTEASGAVAVAAALARSEEVKRLSSIGAAIARSAEASRAVAAAAALARSEEVKRLSSIGAAIARSAEASRAVAAAAALARSEELKCLSNIGAAIARSTEASKVFAISASVGRMGDAYRSSIASALEASSELRMGIQVRPLGSSSLFDESAIGFSRLSYLSHVVHTEEPFSRTVRELIGDEFGDVNTPELSDNADERDEAAMRAGLNPELIAFPRATYDKVLFSAGFRLSFASVPVPQAIEEPDAGAAFNPQHWQILNELEQRLRQVVEQHLKKLSGSNWTRKRVPQTVRERWLDRQKEDRADGRSVYVDIQYADFMDLADVIMRRDNWGEAFQAIFGDANDIAVSLRRLHPIRKALAHSRPLGRADVLTLVSEATRIFRALGMRVLH